MRQKGSALLLIIIIIALIGLVGYWVYQNTHLKNGGLNPSPITTNIPTNFPVPSSSVKPSPIPTQVIPTQKPTLKPTPTATPFGLNDPVAADGHCYTPENNWYIPPKGNAPLYVTLSTSGPGFDYTYAGIAGYQWDFDGDGTWDTGLVSSSLIGHIYTQNGTYKPKLRARSSKNTWTPTCDYSYTIVVGETPEYTNDSISIDKINPSVTISKSTQETVVGFAISTKDKGIPIRFEGDDINNYNHSYGITESSGADMDAGMLYTFHLFANKSAVNGTYSRDATVRYATDNGTVWHDGPVIHYSITVTD
jgi:hypothetical protein